jgi:hypothetical protein
VTSRVVNCDVVLADATNSNPLVLSFRFLVLLSDGGTARMP